jgi:hypothetical protein
MGNDGGKVGSNVGMSQRQIAKGGEKTYKPGKLHKHKTVVSGRGPAEGVSVTGHTLNVGRRTGQAAEVGVPQKGVQRANVMNQLQSHLTSNVGVKANGMAGRGRHKVGFRTDRTSTRNPSGVVTGRVVAVARTKSAALRAAKRGIGSGKNGLSRIGGKQLKNGVSYAKVRGGWRASVKISVRGSKALPHGNSGRRGKATGVKSTRPARSRGGQGARKTPARKVSTKKVSTKKVSAKKTSVKTAKPKAQAAAKRRK